METEKFKLKDLFNDEISSELAKRIVECRDTNTFLTLNEAKEFIKTLHLQTAMQYYAWHSKNKIVFLPKDPDVYYKNK